MKRRRRRLRAPQQSVPIDLEQVSFARELFWHNVVREMLTSLGQMQRDSEQGGPKNGADAELFDGRTAVITRGGERIPIAEVAPLFAFGLTGQGGQREAAMAVECTVFRIRTPGGEVFTMPVSEVRAIHSLTPQLVKELEQSAIENVTRQTGEDAEGGPFGFAAFVRRKQPEMLPDEPGI
ncbi:MAG: hypothetical protein H7Y88_11540 [Phycisphaerales bacterium]|nr:hypothetical protein [Phycisphaerales bacterium]